MKKAISFELQSNNIAIITIDLPDSKVNLLSRDTMLELDQCIEEAKSKNAKGIIVCSGKEDNLVQELMCNRFAPDKRSLQSTATKRPKRVRK